MEEAVDGEVYVGGQHTSKKTARQVFTSGV